MTGDDREVLAFDSSDILGFMAGHESDFEEKSSYSITVVARSGAGHRRLSSTLDVTVEVVDTEDVGAVVCPRGSRRRASPYTPRPATPTAA